MRLKSFVYYLAEELENPVREEIHLEKGKVVHFAVQFEARIADQWQSIARYDTVHGFAHLDLNMPDGSQRKFPLLDLQFSEALSYAEKDFKTNWKRYREGYERGLSKRRGK